MFCCCVRKSKPDYYDRIEELSMKYEPVELLEELEELEKLEGLEELEEQVEELVEVDDIVEPKQKRVKANYNHRYWPSPRPVNFVKYLRKEPFYNASLYEDTTVKTRLTHTMALNILAKYAGCSLEEFLEINPLIYAEKYLKYNHNNKWKTFPYLDGYRNKLYYELQMDQMREAEKVLKENLVLQ